MKPHWPAIDELAERFPSIRRLRGRRTARKIPYVQQASAVDCGAACLAMVLGYHGRYVPLEEVRRALSCYRDGTSAMGIVQAANLHGLRGRGIRIELEELRYLPKGSILFWEFRHFVVFERVSRRFVEIIDPGGGRRKLSLEQFGKAFTGVAITFERTERFEPVKRPGRPFGGYLRQILGQSGLFSKVVVASVLIQVFSLALPILTGVVVDRVVPRGDLHLLVVLAAGLLVFVAFHLATSMLRAFLILHLRTRLDLQMTMGFVEHLVRLSYAFFQLRPAGDLLQRMNSNSQVREIVTSSAISGLLDGSLVSLYLVLLFLTCPPLGLLVLILGGLQVGLFLITRRRQRDLMAQGLEAQAQTSNYQVEMLTGMETLKSLGAERQALTRWSNLFVDSLNVSLARGRLDAIFESLIGALSMASPLVILAFGSYQVILGGLSLGTMLAVSALAAGFLGPLTNLVATAQRLLLMGSYVERLNDVMEAAPEQDLEQVHQPPRLKGQIELEKVSFRYGPLTSMVVKDVSIRIEPGQCVAIVGQSGSGKSTLAKLLLGLHQPVEGRILYDGQDLRRFDLAAVRGQIGVVTQDPQLFSGSIRSNICLTSPDLTLAEVTEAAGLARIHDEILAMPMGYETILADRGLSLSGGQRQRIALARALARRPSILLLDEATSSLDAINEHEIFEALGRLACTRIVIAHRLSTIRDADMILVMEDGRLLEWGRYQELIERDGTFANLLYYQRAANLQ